MKNIRLATRDDMPRLNEIWALCFGDGEKFRDFYFRERFRPEETLVYLTDDQLVAMLTMIPVDLWQEEERIPLSMFYAIATHPQYQHQGIASMLMDYATEYQKNQGTKGIAIVPATVELFPFYLRQGYEEFFAVREKLWEKEQEDSPGTMSQTKSHTMSQNISPNISPNISQSTSQAAFQGRDCKIEPITPEEYNTIRRQYMQENFLLYRDEEVAYQKSISRFSGADIYSLTIQGIRGCGAVERLNEDTLLFKELLLPPELVEVGVRGMAELLPGRKYLIRTPIFSDEKWDENCRPFGVIKWLTEGKNNGKNLLGDSGIPSGYLGLAFD